MKKLRIGHWLIAGAIALAATPALAQKKSGAETSLIGIKLYDRGTQVLAKFGTPDEIEAVSVGTLSSPGGGGPGAGAPGGFGPAGPGGPPRGGPGGGGAGPGAPAAADVTTPDPDFSFGDAQLLQMLPKGKGGGGRPSMGPGAGAPAGIPGVPGGPGGAPTGPAGGANTQQATTVFTRWVYLRHGCKYGFVFDKYQRVVQIEAIGIHNSSVRTHHGITLGATFKQVTDKYAHNPDGTYNAPDGYDINGDSFVVRYLVTDKIAFRLSRLETGKPDVVTGIAIAAGKL